MMTPPTAHIYLASKSPRRKELLRQIGVDFESLRLRNASERGDPDVSEIVHPGEAALDYVARVANEKAVFGSVVLLQRHRVPRPVLAADTCVVVDGDILGKPADALEAMAMLARLSGRTHQVLTAIAVHHQGHIEQLTQVSDVRFGVLSQHMIEAYCATPEPYDKAGGYGIQGAAALFVEHIQGSHSGIMGLPLFETAQLLRRAGIPIL
jgi:septum formation protein